jgi:hypothetical protein
VLTSLFPSSSPFPMAVGAPRSSKVLHRVSGRSRPRLGFLSPLWLDNLGARVLMVLAYGGVGFSCCSFQIRPFWSSFCLAAAGSRGVGKTSPRIADLPARMVCLCWLYVFGGICRCPIYGEKPRRNRRDEVGAGSVFGRLGGGWWVANLAVGRFSRSEAEPP